MGRGASPAPGPGARTPRRRRIAQQPHHGVAPAPPRRRRPPARPVSPSTTISAMPPTRVATSGRARSARLEPDERHRFATRGHQHGARGVDQRRRLARVDPAEKIDMRSDAEPPRAPPRARVAAARRRRWCSRTPATSARTAANACSATSKPFCSTSRPRHSKTRRRRRRRSGPWSSSGKALWITEQRPATSGIDSNSSPRTAAEQAAIPRPPAARRRSSRRPDSIRGGMCCWSVTRHGGRREVGRGGRRRRPGRARSRARGRAGSAPAAPRRVVAPRPPRVRSRRASAVRMGRRWTVRPAGSGASAAAVSRPVGDHLELDAAPAQTAYEVEGKDLRAPDGGPEVVGPQQDAHSAWHYRSAARSSTVAGGGAAGASTGCVGGIA